MTNGANDSQTTASTMEGRTAGRPRQAGEEGAPAAGVTALSRGLDILGALVAAAAPLGNRELASRTGLPKATVSRLTHTLVQSRYLDYDGRTGRYALGAEALSLGYAALNSLDIRRVARPVMQRLADAAGFNVGLALRNRNWMIYTDTVEGGSMINLRLVPGSRVPITTSAIGRAYLAALTDEQLNAILAEIAPDHNPQQAEMRDRVAAAIADYRRVGFCTSIGDWQRDISAVAAPIAIFQGQGPYALNLGGPSYLLPEDRLKSEFGPMLAAAAAEIRGAMS